jgi:hypothetical protein
MEINDFLCRRPAYKKEELVQGRELTRPCTITLTYLSAANIRLYSASLGGSQSDEPSAFMIGLNQVKRAVERRATGIAAIDDQMIASFL